MGNNPKIDTQFGKIVNEQEHDYYTTLAKIFDTQDLVSPPFLNYEKNKSEIQKCIGKKRKEKTKKSFRYDQRGGKPNDKRLL